MKTKTRRWINLGLSCLSLASVIGEFIFVAKETPKYLKDKESYTKDTKKIKKVLTFVKDYKFSLIFAGIALTSATVSKLISAKTEASLLATAGLLDTSFRRYKGKVKETLGINTHKDIIRSIMKEDLPDTSDILPGEVLAYEEHIGYFYVKPENVWKANIKMANDILGLNSYHITQNDIPQCTTIGEFLKACSGRPLSHNLTEEKLNFGWVWEYLKEFYNYETVMIDFDEEPDENGVRLLTWRADPIWNPCDWQDYIYGLITPEEYFKGSEGINIPEINSQYYQRMVNEGGEEDEQ